MVNTNINNGISSKTALLAGVLYVITFVSIPTLTLYGPIHEPNYILGNGTDNAVTMDGILEVIVALAGIANGMHKYLFSFHSVRAYFYKDEKPGNTNWRTLYG